MLSDLMRRELMRYFNVEVVNDGTLLINKMHEFMPAAVVIDS